MNELNKIKAWNTLKQYLAKMTDKNAYKLYYNALLARAINTYGFNPENPASGQKNDISVDIADWEQDLLQDVKDSITYGIDTFADKRVENDRKCRAQMIEFISEGGTWYEIPSSIRSDSLYKLYRECQDFYFDELIKGVKNGVLHS